MENGRDSEVLQEVCHAVAEKRGIDLSFYHYPALFVYYLFDSWALFYEVKNRKGLSSAISGWVTLGTGEVGVYFCIRVCMWDCVCNFVQRDRQLHTVYLSAHTYPLCIKKRKKKSAIVHFLSTSCPSTLNTTTDGCVSSER